MYACLWKPEIDSIFPVTLHSIISITITIIVVVLLTKSYYVALVGLELASASQEQGSEKLTPTYFFESGSLAKPKPTDFARLVDP